MTAEERSTSESAAIRQLGQAREKIIEQLSEVIVGQNEVIEELLISLFSRGHCLLEGVPGLAKTLMISTLSRTLNLSFSRIQFTPDLMPADITGTEIIEENRSTGSREFRFLRRAAVRQRDPGGRNQSHAPQDPGCALGGDARAAGHRRAACGIGSPIRSSCWPRRIPSSRKGPIRCPKRSKTASCSRCSSTTRRSTRSSRSPGARRPRSSTTSCRCSRPKKSWPCSAWCARCRSSDHVIRYCLSLVRQTRVGETGTPDFVQDQLSWGAGPRAVQFLVLGGKARALLHGRTHVSTDDIQALAKPVLRHRLVVNFAAESEGVTTDQVVDRLLDVTPTKEDELTNDARFQKIFAS